MTVTRHEIRQGAYYDSVVLMQLQRSLVQLDEVEDAGVGPDSGFVAQYIFWLAFRIEPALDLIGA